MSETMQDEQAVELEPTDEDQSRMEALDAAIAEHGIEGGEPDEGTRGLGSAQSMIAEAKKHIGYHESGDNDATFNHWLGTIGGTFRYPWCHCFVSYCLWHSDNAGAGPKTAGCAAGVAWFKAEGRFGSTPHVGDLVYYGPGGGTHVELVTGVSGDSIQTIGGNTSGYGATGSAFFNGDGVYQKTVKRTSRIYGYGSPKYAAGAADPGQGGGGTGSSVEPWTKVRSIRKQQEAVNSLGRTPPLDVDGEWGPLTEKGVKWLQKRVGCSEVDGQWGDETERLFKAFK
jgi:CHAP domain-containing protein/putative peptidoglycan binding protein